MNFSKESAAVQSSQGTAFANPPFDQPDGDIIICSSDGIYFRTFKLLLSLVSPIFKDMFDFPRPVEGGVDRTEGGLPIVDLTEDGQTIENLLSFSYPAIYSAKALELETLSEVSALVEAATKYEMEETCRAVVPLLTKPQFLKQEPLRVFAIACHHRLVAEARLAAKHTLDHPLLGYECSPELAVIDGRQLYRVLLYRKECAETAMRAASDHSWIAYPAYSLFGSFGSSRNYTFFGCESSPSFTDVTSPPSRMYQHGRTHQVKVHAWWLEYMESTRDALQSSTSGKTAKDMGRVSKALVAAARCDVCGSGAADNFRAFISEFAREIDRRIADVNLHLDFQKVPCTEVDGNISQNGEESNEDVG